MTNKPSITRFFADRLSNLITGLGSSMKDKTVHDTYQMVVMDDAQLEAAYRGDWIARKIVDIVPADMMREGWNWQAKESQIERLEETERKFCIHEKVEFALTSARLWGGAGIYIGTEIGSPTDELKPEQMVKDGINYLHVFNRRDLSPQELITDPADPWFGHPRVFQLNFAGSTQAQIEVHPSRVIRFVGMPHPDPLRAGGTAYWGDSVLQIVWDAIKNASSSQQHVAALIPEAKVDILTVPGLSDMLSTEAGTQKVVSRFQGASLIKSMFGFVLTEGDNEGGGEQYQQKQIRFTEFPDLLRMFLQTASGAADVPVTRLLNQSPTGLNNNGEGDLKNYYDNIKARQKKELKPQLDRLFEFTIKHTFGTRPKSIYYEFAPLWQMSAKEKAEIGKIRGETDAGLVNSSLVPAQVMEKATRNRLIEEGGHPGIEEAYEEYDADPEAQALEMAAKGLGPDGKPLPPEPGEIDPETGEPAVPAAPPGGAEPARRPALRLVSGGRRPVTDALPRSLYVYRRVINTSEIEAWARQQGFKSIVPDLHVTLIHSREPVDWMKVYTAEARIEVPPGGPRIVEPIGNKGAVALLFNDPHEGLKWRHEHFKRIGAVSDHEDYVPHVTISYRLPGELELEKVQPYTGRILLGHELFEEVLDGWRNNIEEKAL